MGKASRNKGKRGELECAALMRAHGFDAKRGVQYHGGPDSPDVTGIPGVHVEVKRTESLNLYGALEQSKADAAEGEIPVVMHRRNRREWVAIMRGDDFLDMCARLEEARS